MCQVQYLKEKEENGKRKLMTKKQYLLNQLKNEKRSLHLQWNKKLEKVGKKEEKARIKSKLRKQGKKQ